MIHIFLTIYTTLYIYTVLYIILYIHYIILLIILYIHYSIIHNYNIYLSFCLCYLNNFLNTKTNEYYQKMKQPLLKTDLQFCFIMCVSDIVLVGICIFELIWKLSLFWIHYCQSGYQVKCLNLKKRVRDLTLIPRTLQTK